MRSHQLDLNKIEHIDDTKTIYSICQSNLRKTDSYDLKDSMIDYSIVIDSQYKNQSSYFLQNNHQNFKQKEQMAKKLYSVLSQNDKLKQTIKTLQLDRDQIKKDLQKSQKNNINQPPMKKVQSQNQDKISQAPPKQNKNKNQLLSKIGSLNLQLQREKRQKQTAITSFNQQKNNMIQQLKFMKQQNQLKQNRINQLNLQIIHLQQTISLNKKQYEKQKQERQKQESFLQSKKFNKSLKSSLNLQKGTNKQVSQAFKSSFSNQNTKAEDGQFTQYLLNSLMEKAGTLFQDNAVFAQKNKTLYKANQQLKYKIKIIQNQNKKLKGQNTSFQSMINMQQQQISKIIKMHQSQFSSWTKIQSQHLQKKYEFYRTQNQNLNKKVQQIIKSKQDAQSKYKTKIIELQKGLIQRTIPKQSNIRQSQIFSHLCGDLYSNLYSQYERLKKVNIELTKLCYKKQKSSLQKLKRQQIKNDELSKGFGKIMKQTTIVGENQIKRKFQGYYQEQSSLQLLQIRKVISMEEKGQQLRNKNSDPQSVKRSSHTYAGSKDIIDHKLKQNRQTYTVKKQ